MSERPLALIFRDEWAKPREGQGLPDGWGIRTTPSPPPLSEERCEAACLRFDTVRRCLRERGHDGYHAVDP